MAQSIEEYLASMSPVLRAYVEAVLRAGFVCDPREDVLDVKRKHGQTDAFWILCNDPDGGYLVTEFENGDYPGCPLLADCQDLSEAQAFFDAKE